MQEREVGRDLNLGGKISASRTKGTEDFDKHFPKVDVDISTTSQANVAQDMLFDSVDHESDVCQSPFYVELHTKAYEPTSETSSAGGESISSSNDSISPASHEPESQLSTSDSTSATLARSISQDLESQVSASDSVSAESEGSATSVTSSSFNEL